MNAHQTLLTLLQQHTRLRDLAGAALTLAVRELGSDRRIQAFRQAIVDLRAALTEHNVCEEGFLALLLASDPAGPARAKRMMDEHLAEHAAFARALIGGDLEIARRLPELVRAMETHLQAEERTFLHPAVLAGGARATLARI
jgi:hypothetical protein